VEKKWKNNFSQKIDEIFDSMLHGNDADVSPIMESIQSVAISAFGDHRVEGIPKKLIVVSDMLQNTSGFSHYQKRLDYILFKKSPYYIKVRPKLNEAKVEIFYLRRRGSATIQGKRHSEFWQKYFSDNNGNLILVESIEG